MVWRSMLETIVSACPTEGPVRRGMRGRAAWGETAAARVTAWGRSASPAGCSALPTPAHPTPILHGGVDRAAHVERGDKRQHRRPKRTAAIEAENSIRGPARHARSHGA